MEIISNNVSENESSMDGDEFENDSGRRGRRGRRGRGLKRAAGYIPLVAAARYLRKRRRARRAAREEDDSSFDGENFAYASGKGMSKGLKIGLMVGGVAVLGLAAYYLLRKK